MKLLAGLRECIIGDTSYLILGTLWTLLATLYLFAGGAYEMLTALVMFLLGTVNGAAYSILSALRGDE